MARWLLCRGTRLMFSRTKAGMHTPNCQCCTSTAPRCSCPPVLHPVPNAPSCSLPCRAADDAAFSSVSLGVGDFWGCVLRRKPRGNPVGQQHAESHTVTEAVKDPADH